VEGAARGGYFLKEPKMDAPTRKRAVVFVVPMIVGLVTAQRAAPHVRLVDFLLLFASGVVFGVSLMGVIQSLRPPRQSSG
jgi:hypothetical protein